MIVQKYINSIFNSVSYRLGGVIIDPGDEWEGFYDARSMLLTHAHFDHIYGLNRVIELNPNVSIYTNEFGKEMLLDAKKNLSKYLEIPIVVSKTSHIVTIMDGESIILGNDVVAKAIFTPGHNPSCITWIIEDSVFTGDAYIPGLNTVINLPGGNEMQAQDSIHLIKQLAKGKRIYPGHNLKK